MGPIASLRSLLHVNWHALRMRPASTSILTLWLGTLAITLSTWLVVYAQIKAGHHYSSSENLQGSLLYVNFGLVLTIAFVASACVLHAVMSRLISSEESMRRQAAEMQNLAEMDILTGLPNRYFLMQFLKNKLVGEHLNNHISLLFIDLNNFKLINDALGHNYGDELLKGVATRLRKIVGRNRILARIGGDEFIVVVEDQCSSEQAQELAQKIIKGFGIAFGLRGGSYIAGLSIGISTLNDDNGTEFDLLKQADLAMYAAKCDQIAVTISGYRHYNEELSSRALNCIERQQELQYAIRDREFFLDYQPILDAATGHTEGVEAILRWHHPEKGVLKAEDFLPFADEKGFGVQICQIAIEMALRQFGGWQVKGRAPKFISIKVSGSQLTNGGFVDMLMSWLSAYDINPTALHVEFKEIDIQAGAALSVGTLDALRALGIKVVIDAFGSGVTSIKLLKGEFLFGIKVDRNLMRDIHKDISNVALFDGIVALAQKLGLSVTVDGVDNDIQRSWLRRYKSVAVQGDIAPAVPAADFHTIWSV